MLNGYKMIALCLSRIYDTSIIEFISKLNENLSNQGYKIFLYHSKDFLWNKTYQASEASIFELIDYSIVDAVIIMDETIKNRLLAEHIIANANKANVPVYIVDGYYENCVNVRFDYKAGFEEIVRHVMEVHKPKKIHFMAGIKDNKFSEERQKVFCDVLKEYHIDVTPQMISYGDFWADPTIKATLKLINEGNIPDAIICANDIMAINVIAVLKEHGYRVPEDVLVTGFDGMEEIHITQPKVTTGICDYAKLADKVVDLIVHPAKTGDYHVMPTLFLSESCGCTYTSKINILDNFASLNRRFYKYQDDNCFLTEIAEDIQNCTDIEEASLKLNHNSIKYMCCILNKRCLDDTLNPMLPSKHPYEEEMYLLYDTLSPKPFLSRDFKRKDIVPNIDVVLPQNAPLVFASLDYLNICFGYVCFYFNSVDSANYGRIPQIVNALKTGIGGLINQRHQRYLTKRIEHIYTHDALTGLLNRLEFNKKCDTLIKQAKEQEATITIVLADLDDLKFINDYHGHTAGDHAIHMVAKALKQGCPSNALCVRFGGDEMLAVIEGTCDVALIKSKITQFLDDFNRKGECPYNISTSLGIFQAQATGDISFESLLKEVDVRMYEDKKRKKLKKAQNKIG